MFTSTALAVVIIDYQSPRLVAGLETLGDVGYSLGLSLRGIAVMIKSNVHVTTFVVYSLHITSQSNSVTSGQYPTHGNHYVVWSVNVTHILVIQCVHRFSDMFVRCPLYFNHGPCCRNVRIKRSSKCLKTHRSRNVIRCALSPDPHQHFQRRELQASGVPAALVEWARERL